MPASITLPFFKYIRVEEFFSDIETWDRTQAVVGENFNAATNSLELQLSTTAAGLANPLLVIHILRADTYRLRFNPGKTQRSDYPEGTSRAIVIENVNQKDDFDGAFTVAHTSDANTITLTTTQGGANQMRLIIHRNPYGIETQNFEGGQWVTVLRDDNPAIRFRRIDVNGWNRHDWSIVSARRKFAFTKYIGFGEKGGGKLCHNGSQLSYFNFDNMRYRQVYNRGPLDPREPLYDTNPFFLEFAAAPGRDSVAGTFMDNTSQLCLDIGFLSTSRVLLGSFFGDLDMYGITASSCRDVFKAHTRLIGTSRLKPRFVLGYHQGCYGYENRDTLFAVANAYRANRFPIDGLHIDVDIQDRYRTFTIDQQKFPNPQEMFTGLRNLGVKCSTNITPVISNRGDGYHTYQDGLAKNFFINDQRVLPHPGNFETHQDFDTGFESFHGNTNPRINNGQPFEGEVFYGGDRGTPGHYPDLGRKEVRVWWGQQYQFLFDMGLEFVWQDMTSPCIRDNRGDMRSLPFDLLLTDDSIRKFEGDGVTASDDTANPVYPKAPFVTIQSLFSYNLHKATYYGLNELPNRKGKRNFIIGRGGFAGTQRFAALWTGDNSSDWEFYRINVAQVLGLGMSGQSMSGADIGGFEAHNGESWADPELFTRWMIAGAFLPWFRNHYIAKGVKQFQEPYRFAEVLGRVPPEDRFLYESVLPVTRYYVELRYRLMQVFYDAMFENVTLGTPIVRPLFMHHEEDDALFADKVQFLDDEFLLGSDLLIAPVMLPRSQSGGQRDIYLPGTDCEWYLFMNAVKPLELPVRGGTTVRFDASVNADPLHIPFILPIYVHEGGIIPSLELEQYVGERRSRGLPHPVTLYVYPGAENSYTLYLDDGVSRASAKMKDEDLGGDPEAKSAYQEVKISHRSPGAKQREVLLEVGHNQYTPGKDVGPGEDYFFVGIVHDPREAKGASGPLSEVKVEGAVLPLLTGGSIADRSDRLWAANDNRYYYHEAANITYLKVFYQHASKKIELAYV